MLGEDHTVSLLSKMMELSTSRQKVIANNLANANTPGYIRRELDFKDELSKLIKDGDFESLKQMDGKLILDKENVAGNDGNNVHVSSEMNEMSQNGILFSLTQKALKTKMNIIKSAIK